MNLLLPWRVIRRGQSCLPPTLATLDDRADHLSKVLKAVSVYVTAILDAAAQNVPGGLDLRQIDALLSDLESDVTGTLRHAAEGTAGRGA